MSAGITSKALKKGFEKMVDTACGSASTKMTNSSSLTEQEKQGVKGLICESMKFTTKLVIEGNASAAGVGVHLITNGINLGKLTKSQQVYCAAIKAEIALNAAQLAGIAAATYAGAVAGGNGGVVAGGITGTVVAGPAGTVAGAAVGGIVGAGGPLLMGSYEMYKKVATITDLAIDYHSQCGPLVMDKVPPRALIRAAPLP